jgi:uncharacterized protein YndB with AHSA1/START domain
MTPIKEIEFERIYDAPIDIVWKAWTDPDHLKEWWGPDNVSIPECEVDLRVGGRIYIVMEAGEAMGPYKGTRWPMEGKYTVVEKDSKLTYVVKAWTEGQDVTTEIDQITELMLFDENGKTKIRLKATINKTGSDAKMAVEGMKYGFEQQLDKLSKFLGE